MEKLGWHFDLHSHKSVRIGHAPEFAAATLKAAGVDEVITFAWCHNGFNYYPTRVATPHPRLKADVPGGRVKACHKAGSGADCRFERRGNVLAVDVTMDGIWKVVRVGWV